MTIDIEQGMKDLVSKGIKIPPQPKILIELRNLLASEDYDVRALASIINADPGISAMLFKAARSPIFGRGKKFDNIEQVVMVIGVTWSRPWRSPVQSQASHARPLTSFGLARRKSLN